MRWAHWLALAMGLIALQLFVTAPRQSLLWSAVFDAGHIPLHGLLALALRRLLGGRTGPALLLTIALGGLLELAQIPGPRDASVIDFGRGALGAGGFLWLAQLVRDTSPRTSWVRRIAGIAILALLAAALLPLGRTLHAYIRRDDAFPIVCDFTAPWIERFIRLRDAELTPVARPSDWPGTAEVVRVTFRTAPYPALLLREPCPDWSGQRRLVFEVYSASPDPVQLLLRIDDAPGRHDYRDRFNRALTISPGVTRIEIPLTEIAAAPADRTLALTSIRSLALFLDHPAEARSLYFDRLMLAP